MRTGELYQRYHGIYLAEVIDVEDPESLGRVRVKADQFEDTMSEPVWASVIRPAAGDGTGVFFTPKAGDQVVLGYVVGDVREPIVLGYAHSALRRPDTSKVDTQKHAIVTTIGRVTFDEQGRTIVVAFDGPPASTVTLDARGITLDGLTVTINATTSINLAAPSIGIAGNLSMGPAGGSASVSASSEGIDIRAPKVCVNGHGVVLVPFIEQVFALHTHSMVPPPAPPAPTTPPSLPNTGLPVRPDQGTPC